MAGEVSDHCTYRVYFHSHVGTQGEPCLLGTNLVVPLGLTVPGEDVEPCEGDLSLKGVANQVVQLVQARKKLGCT